jgi:broad specificity phosphatase PhoE
MKIGLVRHFEVLLKKPPRKKFLTQSEILEWLEEYDRAEIEKARTSLKNVPWQRCYSSDLPRAITTAKEIYKGEIVATEALRELRLNPIFKADVKLPYLIWPLIIRIAWLVNHKSQITYKLESFKRIKNFIDEILSLRLENILIVSHGVIMYYLRKELKKRGFRGPKFSIPVNGELYIFEN